MIQNTKLNYKRDLSFNNPLNTRSADYVIPDPYFDDVVLFLKGDGTNGSTDIIDSSPIGQAITVNGNTNISTTISKYGGSSIYFDGVGDYLSFNGVAIGTDLFTAEAWFYSTSLDTTQGILGANINEASGPSWAIRYNGTDQSFMCWWNSYNKNFISPTNVANINEWNHVALVRSGAKIELFVNGISVISSTDLFNNNLSRNTYVVGKTYSNRDMEYFQGYIDSLRVTKGIARYTANFNPETDTYLDM